MYHKVGATIDGSPDPFINVSSISFERQMLLMSRLGYVTVTFAEAVAGLKGQLKLPRRCFAVTFDDGYCCVGEHALPILSKFGFSGTVFAVSGAVGRENAWDHANGKPVHPLMSWDQLKKLRSSGWEIGCHTKTHPRMDGIEDKVALAELIESKALVEERIGGSAQTFCYPYGLFNKQTPALVEAAGYTGACTTRSGIASDSSNAFLLPRVKVSHSDGVAGLLYKLNLRPMLPTLRKRRHGVGF